MWAGVDNMDVVHPCPHVPQGEGRSEGLVHKSTGFFPDNQLTNCTTALIHTQKTEFYPQILPKSLIFLSSGEITPFQLLVVNRHGEEKHHILGQWDGSIMLETHKEKSYH